MNTIRRFLAAVLCAVCISLVTGQAYAQQYTIKFATIATEGSTWMTVLHEYDAAVRKESGGRMGFKIYAGGVQGEDKDVMRKIRLGLRSYSSKATATRSSGYRAVTKTDMSISPDAANSIEGAISTCVSARAPMMLISLKYSPNALTPEKFVWPKENETKRPPGLSMLIPACNVSAPPTVSITTSAPLPSVSR